MISPVIQMPEMGEPQRIRGVSAGEIEQEAEPLEVLPNNLDDWVSAVELEFGPELHLDSRPEANRHSGNADLRALGVEIPAEALKMATEEHHVGLQAFLGEWWWRRRCWSRPCQGWTWRCWWEYQGEECRTMRLHVPQARHAIGLPAD
jgi:hypothetical protein